MSISDIPNVRAPGYVAVHAQASTRSPELPQGRCRRARPLRPRPRLRRIAAVVAGPRPTTGARPGAAARRPGLEPGRSGLVARPEPDAGLRRADRERHRGPVLH